MELIQANEDGMLFTIKGLFYIQDILYKLHGNHKTKIQSRDTKHKKKETEKNIMENHKTKMANINTREEKEWRYRAIRKQKTKWQQ